MGVRPLRLRDGVVWAEVRRRNAEWLGPWEATPPGGDLAYRDSVATFTTMTRALRRQARQGTAFPFVVTLDGGLVGQLTIGNIVRGSLNSGYAGYWVDGRVAGRGIMPTALALAVDHCFAVGLHRVEANIRPENTASRRVVEKLGFREEGARRRYLHIAGAYRDHLCFAITPEDVPEGLLVRWRSVLATSRHTDGGA
ncbi:MAG TPA: GNAT family protein [Mycobacteriales bacterium]|nr:GNAT family protein [Mycobacteriales bacterium]